MKSHRIICRSYFIFLLSLITLSLSAQTKKNDTEYVPRIGQEGKDVIWVPTPDELVDKMLEIGGVTSNDFVIDLGSGDGRTVIAAAKLGARALGIEYNPEMIELSVKNAKKAGVSEKTQFLQADLFECDLSEATVITMFLLPAINLRLRPYLLELKPGTRIISNTFSMGDWTPDFEVTTKENWNSWNNAMMWIIPAKVEGKWKLLDGELNIRQKFQMIYGSFIYQNEISTISDGRINGNEITFRLDSTVYSGHVSENRSMLGTAIADSLMYDWYASRVE